MLLSPTLIGHGGIAYISRTCVVRSAEEWVVRIQLDQPLHGGIIKAQRTLQYKPEIRVGELQTYVVSIPKEDKNWAIEVGLLAKPVPSSVLAVWKYINTDLFRNKPSIFYLQSLTASSQISHFDMH